MNKIIVILCIVCLAGCASNAKIRTSSFIDNKNTGDSVIEVWNDGEESEFNLLFVEFNDQGQLYDNDLANSALARLENLSDTRSINIIFTHGWHHFAHKDDDNVASFRSMLSQLANEQALLPKDKRHKINGIYLGWRGDSITIPLLKYSTFADRKKSAHKVGFGATPVFLQIESIVKSKRNDNKLITIGHSFGAAVTYSALNPVLQERYISSRGLINNEPNIIDGFGDLVVLMNPAFEALLHLPLFELTQQNCKPYNKKQPTRLMIVTSEADSSVRHIFRGGQLINGFFGDRFEDDKKVTACSGTEQDSLRRIYESAAFTRSPGNFAATTTHCLALNGDRFQVKHKNMIVDHNPYITIQTTEDIVPNHNSIWGNNTISFLTEVLSNSLHSSTFEHIDDGTLHISTCPPRKSLAEAEY